MSADPELSGHQQRLAARGQGPSDAQTSATSPTGQTTFSATSLNSNASKVVSTPVSFIIQPSGKAAIQACVGEPVKFEGDARLVAHQTIQPDGSVVLDELHINPQGARAMGVSSGAEYRLVGLDRAQTTSSQPRAMGADLVTRLRPVRTHRSFGYLPRPNASAKHDAVVVGSGSGQVPLRSFASWPRKGAFGVC